jgi:hypothetical protein
LGAAPVSASASSATTGNILLGSQPGSFGSVDDAAAFITSVAATAPCTFTHTDGSLQDVVNVGTIPNPLGDSSAVKASGATIDYTLTRSSGQIMRGRDAYFAVGRWVGVMRCIGPVEELSALSEACGAWGTRFGAKLGSLYDRFG